MIDLNISYLNLVQFLIGVIYILFFLSLLLFGFFILEKKSLENILFEIVVFFLPFISLIISFYILTEYKNPFFSFGLIFLIFSFISSKMDFELSQFFSFLLFIFSIFFISSSLTLYFDSEKMLFVKSIKHIFYSWNIFSRFLLFLTILGIFISIINKNKKLFYISIFFFPIFYFWDTLTLPDVSINNYYFYLSFITLFSLIVLLFIFNTSKRTLNISYFVLILLPLIFTRDISSFNYINKENLFLRKEKIKKKKKRTLPPIEQKEEFSQIDGKKIFEENCISCHSFDKKILGPSLKEVLPKYRGDKEKLFKFIKKPYKVNPDLPPMPDLGLKDEEIKAVIEFLFKEVKKYEDN